MGRLLIFDLRFTTYPILSELNSLEITLITLRRRGKNLLDRAERLSGWKKIHPQNTKRKYPNPQVNESIIQLRGYEGELRQLIVRGGNTDRMSGDSVAWMLKKYGEAARLEFPDRIHPHQIRQYVELYIFAIHVVNTCTKMECHNRISLNSSATQALIRLMFMHQQIL
jgi:hypothetical protein